MKKVYNLKAVHSDAVMSVITYFSFILGWYDIVQFVDPEY